MDLKQERSSHTRRTGNNMEDYDLSDTIYNMVIRFHKINEKELSTEDLNFLFGQCEDMNNEVFDFIRDCNENLEEWKKDQEHDALQEKAE